MSWGDCKLPPAAIVLRFWQLSLIQQIIHIFQKTLNIFQEHLPLHHIVHHHIISSLRVQRTFFLQFWEELTFLPSRNVSAVLTLLMKWTRLRSLPFSKGWNEKGKRVQYNSPKYKIPILFCADPHYYNFKLPFLSLCNSLKITAECNLKFLYLKLVKFGFTKSYNIYISKLCLNFHKTTSRDDKLQYILFCNTSNIDTESTSNTQISIALVYYGPFRCPKACQVTIFMYILFS